MFLRIFLTVFLRVLLFAGSGDKTVRLWDVATQRQLAVLTGHTDRVFSVAFDGSGKYLASGGARGARRDEQQHCRVRHVA